jgi:hypothetical protein
MFNYLNFKTLITTYRNNAKLIIVITLVCGLLLGAYRYFGLHKQITNSDNYDEIMREYETSREQYDGQIAAMSQMIDELNASISLAEESIMENPIMQINPFDCDYAEITISENSGDNVGLQTVGAWINDTNTEKIFGKEDSQLSKYKNDVVSVTTGSLLIEEPQIRIYDTNKYDYIKVADNIKKQLSQKLTEADLNTEILVTYGSGRSQELFERQDRIRTNLNKMYADLRATQENRRILVAPIAPSNITKAAALESVLKFVITGLVLGLIAGAVLVLFMISSGGFIISKDQMSNMFGLSCFGEGSSEESISLIRANLQPYKNKKILLLSETGCDELNQIMKRAANNIEYKVGHNINDDVYAINCLPEIDAIVLGVKLGNSRIGDIQLIDMKSRSVEKPIIGYIVM